MAANGNGTRNASISVNLVPLPALEELAAEWRDLESRGVGSFFTSWSWIGLWIRLLSNAADLRLIRAALGRQTVGLGVLAVCAEHRNHVIFSKTLRLHATGSPDFDILAIECNGFLVARGAEEMVSLAILNYLTVRERNWDELVLDGLWGTPEWPVHPSSVRPRVRRHANHYVRLAAVRQAQDGYLSLLGAKTRARIRRSFKEYGTVGPLALHAAADKTQALEFFDGLKTLHQSYWISRGKPGAFANPFFERFHRQLVDEAFNRGEIQMLAMEAGGRRLGYIYNFIYQGRVYNYQSGLDYAICEKHNRPGLVAHAYAIEFSARSGHDIYDFLAGDVEYKQALGTDVAVMSWIVLQRDRLRFRVESAMRGIRDRLRHSRQENTRPPAA